MARSLCTDTIPNGAFDLESDIQAPRIQNELDKLNIASGNINNLENELDEARSKYRSIVSGTSGEMESIAVRQKKSIRRAREYYKLTSEAKLAHSEAVRAARQYQTAVGVYRAARETVSLAESRLIEDTRTAPAPLTSAWQEMLNHAVAKVSEAEQDRTNSERDHKRRSRRYAELGARIQVLEKTFTKSIKKARPYFELKAELDTKLMQQKQNVTDLQAAIHCSKVKYRESLRKLEGISEEIHQSRREKFWSKIPRMPGVGSDGDSVTSGLSEFDLKSMINEYSETDDDALDTKGITDNDEALAKDIPVDRDINIAVDREVNTVKGKLDTDKKNGDDDNPVNDTHTETFAATVQLSTTDGTHVECFGDNIEIQETISANTETEDIHECLKTSKNMGTDNDNEVVDCSVSFVSKPVSDKYTNTGVEDGTKCVEHETSGVENENKVVENDTKGVENETNGLENETKGVENETKCVEDETKDVEHETKGVENESNCVKGETKDIEHEIKGVENVDEMDEDYFGCDMQTVDRPSLSGAED